MTECLHKHFQAKVDVHRIVKQEDADELGYKDAPAHTFVFEASASCAECGVPFRFLWDSMPDHRTVIPVTLETMRMGPWTDPMRSMLQAAIVPMPLEHVHVTNSTGTIN